MQEPAAAGSAVWLVGLATADEEYPAGSVSPNLPRRAASSGAAKPLDAPHSAQNETVELDKQT